MKSNKCAILFRKRAEASFTCDTVPSCGLGYNATVFKGLKGSVYRTFSLKRKYFSHKYKFSYNVAYYEGNFHFKNEISVIILKKSSMQITQFELSYERRRN